MKLRELPYLLGFRPAPRSYGSEVRRYELPREGCILYARWLHPKETEKVLRQEAIDELRRYLAPGNTVLDIGAHTGDTTLPLALAVGPQGAVLALEPNPYVFPVLARNAELNSPRTNIQPVMFAATAEDGDCEFGYSDAGYCNGGARGGSSWRRGHFVRLKVQGRNLARWLAARGGDFVERLRLVKVDTEGHDHAVLETIRDLLAARRPFVRAEVYRHLARREREDFYDFLIGLGYRVHLAVSETELQGPPLERRELLERRHFDVFCVPASDSGSARGAAA